MTGSFLKPHLARILRRHLGVHARFNISQLSSIQSMKDKYVGKKLKLWKNKDAEIVIGLDSFDDSSVFAEKKKCEVTYDELMDLLRIGTVTLVDVRDPNELLATGRMPRSINIPLNQLKTVLSEEENLNDLLTDEDAIVFCGLGNVKGIAALEIARKQGLKNVRYYPGGYQEWLQQAAKLVTAENVKDL